MPLRPGQFVPTAGYPGTPPIPQIGNEAGANSIFTSAVPSLYIVDPAHADADGFLFARVDYGQTDYIDMLGLMQDDGLVLTDPPQGGGASVTNATALCVPSLELELFADPSELCGPGAVMFTYIVHNTGEVPLTNVMVVDEDCDMIMDPSGDGNGDGILDPGESWMFVCIVVVAETSVRQASVTAIAIPLHPAGADPVADVVYTATASTTVTVLDLEEATASNDGPVCAGEAVQLTAGPDGLSYSWSGPAGFESDLQNPVVVPAVAGAYCVTVTATNGCTATACTTVVVESCPGACCFLDGSCLELTEEQCTTGGGTFQGQNVPCTDQLCPQPTGACCLADGSCVVVEQPECVVLGGDYQGNFAACTPGLCPLPTAACCFPDGTCQLLVDADCDALGGDAQGPGTVCVPNDCPAPAGACCFEDGSCQPATEAGCTGLGGSWQGAGTSCTPNECPATPARMLPAGRRVHAARRVRLQRRRG